MPYKDKNKRRAWAKEYLKRRKQNQPWFRSFTKAKQRCEDPNNNRYYCYGAKGIKFLLTLDEVKELWFRDRAYEMDRPTLDREDSKSHYEISNCKFMELKHNVAKGNRERRAS